MQIFRFSKIVKGFQFGFWKSRGVIPPWSHISWWVDFLSSHKQHISASQYKPGCTIHGQFFDQDIISILQ